MKNMKLKTLSDEHIEKHGLDLCDKGKIGVFDGDELVGMAEDIAGWQPKKSKKELSEIFASEVGMPGKSLAEIALVAKLVEEQPVDHFAALSECIAEGQLDLAKAGQLADQGKVKFSSILLAEEAQGKIDDDIEAGKVLPKNRQHALKLMLSDPAGYAVLVTEGPAQLDLKTRGHSGGGEQPSATQTLMSEVNSYAASNKCSFAQALSEVSRAKPDLWKEYSKEVQVTLLKGGGDVDEEE